MPAALHPLYLVPILKSHSKAQTESCLLQNYAELTAILISEDERYFIYSA